MADLFGAAANADGYDASNIEVLEGLEPVRHRPGMYIGGTDERALHHLAAEILDNSMDEAVAGHANRIDMYLEAADRLTIRDNGRGMPVGEHPKFPGKSAVEVILTTLHAGGKFNRKNYRFSGGLHGVGISVANALSTSMLVEVKRDGRHVKMQFTDGKKSSDLIEINKVGKKNTGTKVTFYPDPQFFDNPQFDVKRLKKLLQAKAVLCPKLKIEFYDEVSDTTTFWCYDNGLEEYFNEKLHADFIPNPAWVNEQNNQEFSVQWALAWTPSSEPLTTESYVNLIPTQYGGTHVNAMKSGISSAIKQFCEIHDLLPRNLKIKPEDIFLNCSYILSIKMQKPQFAGQTKDRLTAKSIIPYVSKSMGDSLIVWLNKNNTIIKI